MSKFAKAIALLGAVSVVGTISQVAKGKAGALLLGPEGLGLIGQLTTLYTLVFLISGLGLYAGVTRQLASADGEDSPYESESIIATARVFLGIFSLAITLLALLFAPVLSDFLFADGGENHLLVIMILLAVPVAVQHRILRAYLNAKKDIRSISISQTVSDLSSVAIYVFFTISWGVPGAVIAALVMHVQLFFMMQNLACKNDAFMKKVPRIAQIKSALIKGNLGFGASGLLLACASSLATLIVGRLILEAEDLVSLGIFFVAWKAATVYFGALHSSVSSYYFPALIEAEKSGRQSAEVNSAISHYMIIIPPAMCALIVFGDLVIPLMFSNEFVDVVPIMAILFAGDLLRITSETLGLSLLATKKLFGYTIPSLIFYCSYVSLSFLLLPLIGLVGVAIAYVISHGLIFLLLMILVNNRLRIKIQRDSAKVFILGVLIVVPLVVMELFDADLAEKLIFFMPALTIWMLLNWQKEEFQSYFQLVKFWK